MNEYYIVTICVRLINSCFAVHSTPLSAISFCTYQLEPFILRHKTFLPIIYINKRCLKAHCRGRGVSRSIKAGTLYRLSLLLPRSSLPPSFPSTPFPYLFPSSYRGSRPERCKLSQRVREEPGHQTLFICIYIF